MTTTATTVHLPSAVSLSGFVSCERALRMIPGRQAATTTLAGNSNANSSRNFVLECCLATVAGGRQTSFFFRLFNWAPSAAWGKRARNMFPQVSTESKLRLRSVYEDPDDPIVSIERMSKPVSDVFVPDICGGVVALGKFDALHAGHRALTEQAARMGSPVLLSFLGMADVLGWEPRLPVAALCDRKRVMSMWATGCGGVVPQEYALEFVKVRSLSPRDFVQKLSKELHVKGVVAGANYRFGYKAAGTASDLVHLCNEYGLQSFIVDAVMDKDEEVSSMNGDLSGNSAEKGQISSTRIRQALAKGNMERVTNLLGRKHRLVLKLDNCSTDKDRLVIPVRSALNQYPGEGLYKCTLVGTGEHLGAAGGQDDLIGTAQVKVGPAWIEISLADTDIQKVLQRRLLGVEFESGR